MMSLEGEKAEVQALLKRLEERRTYIVKAAENIDRLLVQAGVSESDQRLFTTLQEARAPISVSLSAKALLRLEALKKRLFLAQTREADIREQLDFVFGNCAETLLELQLIIDETKELRTEIGK